MSDKHEFEFFHDYSSKRFPGFEVFVPNFVGNDPESLKAFAREISPKLEAWYRGEYFPILGLELVLVEVGDDPAELEKKMFSMYMSESAINKDITYWAIASGSKYCLKLWTRMDSSG